MFPNAEVLLVQFLNESPIGAEAFADVPSKRPAEFITVERTGGEIATFRDLPMLAVQTWAGSRYRASELAAEVRAELWNLRFHASVARVELGNMYNFPDPDSGHPRYQLTLSMVTK